MAIRKGKRELIDTGTDKRYVKRNPDGTFKESVDVGRSLAADRRSKSKSVAKPGYGDQGDQPKRTTKKAAKKTMKSSTLKKTRKSQSDSVITVRLNASADDTNLCSSSD
jgi:hypothetical protein